MRTAHSIVGLAILGGLAAIPAVAIDYTFVPSDGKWNVQQNWDPDDSGPPGINDKAIIPNGKKCRIEDQDESIRTLDIQSGGTLELNNHKLTIDVGSTPTGSLTVNGTCECLGTGATIRVPRDLSAYGSGVIRALNSARLTVDGYDTSPKLHIAGTSLTVKGEVWFYINVRNDGLLLVDGDDEMRIGHLSAGPPYALIEGIGTFKAADIDGELKFGRAEPGPLLNAGAKFEVQGGVLQVTAYSQNWICGYNRPQVVVGGGLLDLDVDFEPPNALDFTGGKISVAAGKKAIFSSD